MTCVTYSIAAWDPATGRLGIAVQSCVLASGARVPAGRAGVGVVAVQSGGQLGWRRRLLDDLEAGARPGDLVTAGGPRWDGAQIGIVSAGGEAAAHTGPGCEPEAGHAVAAGVTAQGNLLAAPHLWDAALVVYLAGMDEPFEERLLAALRTIEDNGGDIRGSQSAALLVASAEPGGQPTGAAGDPFTDLRVDDHRDPVGELERLLRVKRAHDAVIAAAASGDWPAHAEQLLAAAAQAPGDNVVELMAGLALGLAGRLDDARPLLEAVATRNPRAAERLRRLGEVQPGVGGHPGFGDVLAALDRRAGLA